MKQTQRETELLRAYHLFIIGKKNIVPNAFDFSHGPEGRPTGKFNYFSNVEFIWVKEKNPEPIW